MANTFTQTYSHFVLNGTLPERLKVVDTAPPERKTRLFSVVADYGWAERILCSESYRKDANSIAQIIGDFMEIPVESAEDPLGPVPGPPSPPRPLRRREIA